MPLPHLQIAVLTGVLAAVQPPSFHPPDGAHGLSLLDKRSDNVTSKRGSRYLEHTTSSQFVGGKGGYEVTVRTVNHNARVNGRLAEQPYDKLAKTLLIRGRISPEGQPVEISNLDQIHH